jgi:hypothetical protein
VQNLPNLSVTDEVVTHCSFSVIKWDQYFVSMTPTEESLVWHKYVVIKGNTTIIDKSDKLG